jgi:hypothetical protein
MTEEDQEQGNRHVPEEQLMRELQEWEDKQESPPTLFDVVKTRNANLAGAYVLRGLRAAGKEAVRGRHRVFHLRNLAYAAFGDPQTAEDFLREFNPTIGRTPLQAAVASPDGMIDAIKALPDYVRAIGTHCLGVIANLWTLTESEQAQLFSCSEMDLATWKRLPWHLPDEAFEKIALLLAITKALRVLLPSDAARTWVRRSNNAPILEGLTALELMIRDGEGGIRLVRDYLEAEIWSV